MLDSIIIELNRMQVVYKHILYTLNDFYKERGREKQNMWKKDRNRKMELEWETNSGDCGNGAVSNVILFQLINYSFI